MSEEVFRIGVLVGVALAAISFVVLACVMLALYFGTRKVQIRVTQLVDQAEPLLEKLGPIFEKAGPTLEGLEPVMRKAGPALEKIGVAGERLGAAAEHAGTVLATANAMLIELRPNISQVAAEAAEITRSGHEQVERIGVVLNDVVGRARDRVEQIDHTVENTVEQVEQVGESVKRAVLRPVREVNGLAAGVSAAVSTLVKGRKSSVDSATQDEEMFI